MINNSSINMNIMLSICLVGSKVMLVTAASRFRQATALKPIRPAIKYSFSCGPNGKAIVHVSNATLGDLNGIDLAHCNPLDIGISSETLLESSLNIATMRQAFLQSNATSLAVELWIKPTIHSSHSFQPIVTIASDYYRGVDIFECHLEALAIGLRGNLVEIRYVDDDPYKSCRILLVRQRPLSEDELSQIVLTMHEGRTNVYINGKSIIEGAPNSFMANLTMWNADSTLRLFSNHPPAETYSGSFYQLSIFDQAYPAENIELAYQERLHAVENDFLNRDPLKLLASAGSSRVIQGRSSLIQIGGFNQSMPEYDVWIEVLELPQHGTLLSENGPIRSSGAKLPLQGSASELPFFYRPWSDDFFTSPDTSFSGQDLNLTPDIIKFRLLAIGIDDGELLGWSEPARKDIHVEHVNRPPTLELKKVARVPPEQQYGAGASPIAYLDGVLLKDPDKNIDRVRIDLWTKSGSLVLTENADLADFSPRKNRSYPDWQCHGDPSGSRNMTFLAEPDSVTKILSSLKYEGFFWDREDSIMIRIYDGSGGACLDEDEHSQGTIHNGCYEIIANVTVPPITTIEKDFKLEDISFIQISFWLLVFVPILAFLYVVQRLRSCVNSCRKGSGVRVDGTTVDDISVNEIVE